MRKQLGKYGFEIIVIFIGITSSFIFEEWRQDREKQENSINIMNSLIVELERNDEFMKSADTTYQYIDSVITVCLKEELMEKEDVIDLMYSLMEEVSFYQLKEVSSFVYGFSSLDPVNILKEDEDIIMYVSYLNSLLNEHHNITMDINQQSSKKLWPIIYTYDLNEDMINYGRTYWESDTTNLVGKDFSYYEIVRDSKFKEHVSWTQFKILRLMDINSAIHRRIEDINQALKKAVESD